MFLSFKKKVEEDTQNPDLINEQNEESSMLSMEDQAMELQGNQQVDMSVDQVINTAHHHQQELQELEGNTQPNQETDSVNELKQDPSNSSGEAMNEEKEVIIILQQYKVDYVYYI